VKIFDLEIAFNFVNSAPYGQNSAYLNKETGEVYLESGMGDSDEMPDDINNGERYITVPHKNDMNLGIKLVREFVYEQIPDQALDVEDCFRRRGGYSCFKEILVRCGALEKWFQFEEERSKVALRNWCVENGIQIEDP
jgi:hypothetical protein